MAHIFNAYLAFILCLTTRVVCFNFVLQLTVRPFWKVFFPFIQLFHYFFHIPALLRNWMEQITHLYSSVIDKQSSVNYVLVGAFFQILSQCDPNPMVKILSSHTARAIAFSSELYKPQSLPFHVASYVWCFTLLYIMIICRVGPTIC